MHAIGVTTHQSDGAGRRRLVLALVVEEQQTLAGLAGPCGKVVVLQQRGHLLGVDGLGAEPEELLGVDEVPGAWLATRLTSCLSVTTKVIHTWGSCYPCARVGRPRRARPPSSPPQQPVRPQQQGSRWQAPLLPRWLRVDGQQAVSMFVMLPRAGSCFAYRQGQSPP